MMVILPVSHVDHGLTPEQLEFISDLFEDRDGFFIQTVVLPDHLGDVPCGLHGPIMGDEPVPESECSYGARGDRAWPSRMCNRRERRVRQVTVIAGPHEGAQCVLYTAFGGPLAPREPGDTSLPPEEQAKSREFWAQHALSL